MKEKMYEEALYELSSQADTDICIAVHRAMSSVKNKIKLDLKYAEEYKRLRGLLEILKKGHLYIVPYYHEKKYFKRGRK